MSIERLEEETVVLTASVDRYSVSTTRLAVAIAVAARAHLHGMFIEDEDLVRISGLSIAREISLASGRLLPVDAERMQRSLAAASEQFRQMLGATASTSHVAWSFESVRARVHDLERLSRSAAAITILGDRSHGGTGRPLRDRDWRRVLLLVDSSPHLGSALEAVLASCEDRPVDLMRVGDAGGSPAPDWLQASLPAERRIRLHEIGRETLRAALERSAAGFDFAILTAPAAAPDLERLATRLRCPIVLVR